MSWILQPAGCVSRCVGVISDLPTSLGTVFIDARLSSATIRTIRSTSSASNLKPGESSALVRQRIANRWEATAVCS